MLTFEEILQRIKENGLDFFLMNWGSPEEMPDKKSEELFISARDALYKFRQYIERNA